MESSAEDCPYDEQLDDSSIYNGLVECMYGGVGVGHDTSDLYRGSSLESRNAIVNSVDIDVSSDIQGFSQECSQEPAQLFPDYKQFFGRDRLPTTEYASCTETNDCVPPRKRLRLLALMKRPREKVNPHYPIGPIVAERTILIPKPPPTTTAPPSRPQSKRADCIMVPPGSVCVLSRSNGNGASSGLGDRSYLRPKEFSRSRDMVHGNGGERDNDRSRLRERDHGSRGRESRTITENSNRERRRECIMKGYTSRANISHGHSRGSCGGIGGNTNHGSCGLYSDSGSGGVSGSFSGSLDRHGMLGNGATGTRSERDCVRHAEDHGYVVGRAGYNTNGYSNGLSADRRMKRRWVG